jgi:hypothetical protein
MSMISGLLPEVGERNQSDVRRSKQHQSFTGFGEFDWSAPVGGSKLKNKEVEEFKI